ncbi:PKD domain-containing protein [Flavobacterium sp. JP2137]|uniref:PKD domain-containing protein n=1 Tax=Flavobacterium sp. JP2137 TaxID=3414510 RepID=UPI003D2FFD07
MKPFYVIFALLSTVLIEAQSTKKVFFIGNSYTNTNNIPELTKLIATSAGDQFTYAQHTPGGSTLQQHANNAQVTSTLAQGNWDYVVLQEQSQLPAFPDADVVRQVYPYATALSDKIRQYNPCAQVAFYMTWGRKNGDPANCAFWTPLCTYLGMDNLLQQRYTTMATDNRGILAPVAAVWRYLITNHPEIDLYSADESHPSLAGSMAAAYTFYSIFFQKTPNSATYNSGLPNSTINAIKNAVQQVVFDNLRQWKIYDYDPVVQFNYTLNNNEVAFSNLSTNSQTYLWDFGDGNTATAANPTHAYTQNGTYTVTLKATTCGKTVTLEKTLVISSLSITAFSDKTSFLYPVPAGDYIELNTDEVFANLSIIDNNGKAIQPTYQRNVTTYTIDLQKLSSGSYYLIMHLKDGPRSLPFIKR